MTFRQFVIKNVIRNKRLYAAYFLSSMFTVMVFFTFAMFAFHPALGEGEINKSAINGMRVAGGIIYIFSFFFVLYSMGAFLQSRKKEFGLLMMQGMSMRQVRLMVFLENMFIGIIATVVGIGLGTLFAKLILLIAENFLVIEQVLYFYFPLQAIVITLVSFTLLFLIVSFFVTFILRSKKLAELIKADKQPKSEPKTSVVLTLLALILLVSGYTVAVLAKGIMVVTIMIPVILAVTIGTYFLFTQLSVFTINFLKKRKSLFWKQTNMILFSDLSFRLKDNARTFFMVAIISTVAFSAIGTLFGFQTYITSGVKETNPYSFNYYGNKDQTEEKAEKDINMVDELLEKRQIKVKKATAEMKYFTESGGEQVLIASESMYNEYSHLLDKDRLNVENDEIVGVKQSAAMIGGFVEDAFVDQPVELKNNQNLHLREVIDSGILPELNPHYIVSDETYQQLPKPERIEDYTAWKAAKGQDAELIETGEILSYEIEPYYFQANDFMIYMINKAYGPVLFIGLFIGIVFFVSAGSFLYFRLFTDLDDDKIKFSSIAKMGLTDKELKTVITRQTAILFFTPIVVALIHGAIALTALSHFFDYNLVKESSIVLGSFFVIQVIYFIIVRFVYIKQVKNALQ